MANPLIIIFFVLVHPDLGQSDGIPPEHVHPRPPLVRRPLPEYVTHVTARDYLQRPPAHPRLFTQFFKLIPMETLTNHANYLKRNLQILSPPNVKPIVVLSQFGEKGRVDGE